MKRKWWLLLFIPVLIVVPFFIPTITHTFIKKAQASGIINSVSPSSGVYGTTITIQGSGFGATLRGKITLEGHVVSNFYTDSSGNFTQTFPVPQWATAGATTIVATNTFTSASTSFTVSASSTLPNRVDPVCVSSHLDRLSNSDIDTQLTLMQEAGVKWTRFDIYYYVVNPSQGVWQWSPYDYIISDAASKGIGVDMLLNYYDLPTYLYNGRLWTTPMQPSEYATFAQAVATHYKGQGLIYEMGNEPNSSISSSTTGVTSASYSALLEAGYTAVKAGDPNAKVISAGLSPGGGAHQDPITYLAQMYADGVKGYFDYFAMHPYSQPLSPDTISQISSVNTFNIVARLKTLMEREGDRNKDIMLTEVGWPTGGTGSVSASLQATYISRVYTKVMQEDYQYVPIACIYDFVNDGTDPTDNEDNFGVLNADLSQKPSYTSLQNAAASFSASFTPISP